VASYTMNKEKKIKQNYSIKKRIFGVFAQSEDAVVKVEKSITVITGLVVSLSVFLQVLMRYVFHFSVFGIEELTLIVAMWFYFMGITYSIYSGMYIKVDVLSMLVRNQRVLKPFTIISLFFSLFAAALLCYYSFQYCLWAAGAKETTITWRISSNYITGAVVLGSGLMALHLMIKIRQIFKRRTHG
jgi:TRAP-type C4-dicarboxylate transport system permease small subunit